LTTSRSFTFGPDGSLYVGNRGATEDNILRYNGNTGAFIDEFVSGGSGGLIDPLDIVFGPDDNLYVSNRYGENVLRYDGTTGEFMDVFAAATASHPWGIAFSPNGSLYVSVHNQDNILQYNGTTGAFVGEFVPAGYGGLDQPSHLLVTPEPTTLLLLGLGGLMLRRKR